ncbi:MAG: AAA family ATPase, partial [Clostridiaceae bacterium]|nr:AAA family ATPase [Clostridiaceae bacterium]
MLVYVEEKRDFMRHVRDNRISDQVADCMLKKLGRHVGRSEQRSWQASLHYMRNILDDPNIPDSAGIAIEYNIPQTSNRIDFLISGYDENDEENIVIVELKQWDQAYLTKLDATVRIGRFGNVLHPSYQAWSYKELMEDYNTTVQEEDIGLFPCSYLHNYKENNAAPVIRNEFYNRYLEAAPAFLMEDSEKLRSFIKR